VPRPGSGKELVQEVVRRRREQLAPGEEELRVVLDLPQLRVVRDPLRPEDVRVHGADVVGGLEPVEAHGRRRGQEGEVGDRVDLGAAVPGLRQDVLREDLVDLDRRCVLAERMSGEEIPSPRDAGELFHSGVRCPV
jgi:hypothetical protein